MQAHKFVADVGIERAVSAMEDAHVLAHQIWIDEIGLVDLEELKQVVESVEIVKKHGGLETIKKCVEKTVFPLSDRIIRMKKAIADYEAVEAFKENQHV